MTRPIYKTSRGNEMTSSGGERGKQTSPVTLSAGTHCFTNNNHV